MTTYSVGTTLGSVTSTFVQAAEASIMQAQLRAVIQNAVVVDQELIVGLTLAGGGDGHTFIIEASQSNNATGGNPLDEFGRVACYLAATGEELAVARAAAVAGLVAETPPIGTNTLTLLDEQVAGSSKGTRFMGLIVGVWIDGG